MWSFLRQTTPKVMPPVVDLLSQVQTWAASSTTSIPLLPRAGGPWWPWCDQSWGWYLHHCHKPSVWFASWGHTQTRCKNKSSCGPCETSSSPLNRNLYSSCRLFIKKFCVMFNFTNSAIGAVHVHSFPLAFLRFMHVSKEENGPLGMF